VTRRSEVTQNRLQRRRIFHIRVQLKYHCIPAFICHYTCGAWGRITCFFELVQSGLRSQNTRFFGRVRNCDDMCHWSASYVNCWLRQLQNVIKRSVCTARVIWSAADFYLEQLACRPTIIMQHTRRHSSKKNERCRKWIHRGRSGSRDEVSPFRRSFAGMFDDDCRIPPSSASGYHTARQWRKVCKLDATMSTRERGRRRRRMLLRPYNSCTADSDQ
jgi:hypothetical protein